MNNFFDHIYILNLDRRHDRWQKIVKQLDIAQISKAVRFSAIDKQPGWIGCFESHLAILQTALDNKARNVLILEDDAELYHDWNVIWQSAVKQIPDNWDMLYLGFNLNPDTNLPPPFISHHLLHLNDVLTTHAYAVNGKYMPDLINNIKASIGSSTPIDVVYAKQTHSINAYGVHPIIFKQAPSKSDILGCELTFDFRGNISHVLRI